MAHRYFMELAYNGTSFCGWQIQPNAPSVQALLEKWLTILLKQPIAVVGCGRTDTGVHAKYYVAHFECSMPITNTAALTAHLNKMPADGILVYHIFEVYGDAHARFSAISRSYEYHLLQQKDPFLSYAWVYTFPLDFEKMNAAAALLPEFTDFTSFSKLHSGAKTNNCTITTANWENMSANHWVFRISADRFLRNMVRAIVGTLLEVGRGKLTIDEFAAIIEKKDRGSAGTSAPPQGLFLSDIKYPDLISGFKFNKK